MRGGTTVFGPANGRSGPARATFRRAVEGALDAAGLSFTDLDVVFLHAAGLVAEEHAEAEALREVLAGCGKAVGPPRFVSTKGALGHTGPAAPAIDVVLALRAFAAGGPPAALATNEGRPVAQAGPTRAMILAASSSGGAGAVVVEEAP